MLAFTDGPLLSWKRVWKAVQQYNTCVHVLNETRNVKNATSVYGDSLCSFTTHARLAGALAMSKIIKT